MECFNDDIQFCLSERCNKAILVFSSNLSVEDVVKKLRSMNVIIEVSEIILQTLTNSDFNLDDKFGDEHELKFS